MATKTTRPPRGLDRRVPAELKKTRPTPPESATSPAAPPDTATLQTVPVMQPCRNPDCRQRNYELRGAPRVVQGRVFQNAICRSCNTGNVLKSTESGYLGS